MPTDASEDWRRRHERRVETVSAPLRAARPRRQARDPGLSGWSTSGHPRALASRWWRGRAGRRRNGRSDGGRTAVHRRGAAQDRPGTGRPGARGVRRVEAGCAGARGGVGRAGLRPGVLRAPGVPRPARHAVRPAPGGARALHASRRRRPYRSGAERRRGRARARAGRGVGLRAGRPGAERSGDGRTERFAVGRVVDATSGNGSFRFRFPRPAHRTPRGARRSTSAGRCCRRASSLPPLSAPFRRRGTPWMSQLPPESAHSGDGCVPRGCTRRSFKG